MRKLGLGGSLSNGEPLTVLFLVGLPGTREQQLSSDSKESVNLCNLLFIVIFRQYRLIIISTMSSLAQQLNTIQHQQRALPVAPSQIQPSLLLDQHTATTTSHDLFYTMAVIAYSKLLKEQPNLQQQGKTIMAQQNRQMSRNTLNKDQNRQLSQSLVKFMLKISPFFMGVDCQKVLEYLLHNYKVNIFEAEALAIIYLQYWNTPQYQRLISNIPSKILAHKLPFLAQINKAQPHNITFIVKSLAYSHYLISSLVLYTLQYLKAQGVSNQSMDIDINIGEDYEEEKRKPLLRADPRRFLLQIFNEFLSRKMNNCYKYILEFCGKAVSTARTATVQTCSMVMLLCTRMFIEGNISDQLVQAIVSKLVKHCLKQEQVKKGLFDFLLILWQRRPHCLKGQTLEYLQNDQQFHKYLNNFKCSLWMILVDLMGRYSSGQKYPTLLTIIGYRVKRDEFYVQYNDQLLIKLFQQFEKTVLNGRDTFMIEFMKNNYQYQSACHYSSQTVGAQLKEALIHILPKQACKFNKKGELTCNIDLISKQITTINKQPVFQLKPQQSQQEDNIELREQKNEKVSILQLLKKQGLKVSTIKYRDRVVKDKLMEFVVQYYSGSEQRQLTQQQKNQIMEHLIGDYHLDYFTKDIQQHDFIMPIKYLTASQDVQSAKTAINLLTTSLEVVTDVLYRQLLRLSLNQLSTALNNNYKPIVHYLNTLFKHILNKHSLPSQLPQLSQTLLKISEQTYGKVGTKRGKYQKILHNHSKLIAEMVISLKSKRSSTKNISNDEQMLLSHYLRTLKVFGIDNLYLINIGVIEILTRRDLDHSHIRYFISKILLGGIRQSSYTFYHLTTSIAKTLIFCSQLNSCFTISNSQDLHPSLSSGIAKKTIIQFYGLIKDKFKKVVIKKMLLFIRSIFQNTNLIQNFKLTLVQLRHEELQELMGLFTELYRILTAIESEDNKVLKFRDSLIEKITNLFPLELRITLFEPLLPNQQLFSYLADQLEEHPPKKTKYQVLAELINVAPLEVTFEWVKFIRECLKRKFLPDNQLVTSVLGMIDLEGNLSNIAQFICQLLDSHPPLVYSHIPTCIQVFQQYCQQPNDYTLALITKLIKNLGQMIDPYLNDLVLASLSFQSQYTQQFVNQLVSHLAPSTLIRLVKQTNKKATNLRNFSLLFKEVAIKGVGEALNKTLLTFLNRSLLSYLQSEESPAELLVLQSQIFLNIALKMNQNQLRKYIIDLIRWSEMKSEMQNQLPFNYRKLAVAQCYQIMAQQLQQLFIPFYGFIYESFIADLQNINRTLESLDKTSKKSLKRQREDNHECSDMLIELYLSSVLQSLSMLFKNDKEHQFLDSVKIQALADPLIDLTLLSQKERFISLTHTYLRPCLTAFHSCIADDYQMKTINYKVLLLLKRKNPQLQKFIFELYQDLVQVLQDRFLLLVSDLVPFLLQSVGSRQQGLAIMVRRIISQVEQLSGEQITTYTK